MQKQITIRFYEELNDFLHPSRRKKAYNLPCLGKQSVKDLIESQGVPHTEIDLILINGSPAGFSDPVSEGDYLSVYPVFESIDISPINLLRPRPLRDNKFVLDVHLGKLAKYLRMLGFDCLYKNSYSDRDLIQISIDEQRIILTRDLGILKHGSVTRGYWLRNQVPRLQAREVIQKFDLARSIAPFTRCINCNGIIDTARKEDIIARLQPDTIKFFDRFFICRDCRQIYWEGSHYDRMRKLIEELSAAATSG